MSLEAGAPPPATKDALLQLLNSPNLISSFRSEDPNLISALSIASSHSIVLDFILNSKDPRAVKQATLLFSSSSSSVLHNLVSDLPELDKLFGIATDPSSQFLIPAIQILSFSISLYPSDLFAFLNARSQILLSLPKCIGKLPMFTFISHHFTRNPSGMPLIWIIFSILMDEHTPGMQPPFKQQVQTAGIHYMAGERRNALAVLSSYFQNNGNESSFADGVAKALPILMQDASDDAEVALVFRLGMSLKLSEQMRRAAIIGIKYYTRPTVAVEYALKYISKFDLPPSSEDTEIFLFRVLNHRINSIMMIEVVNLIRTVAKHADGDEFSQHIKKICGIAFRKRSQLKTVTTKALYTSLTLAPLEAPPAPTSKEFLQSYEARSFDFPMDKEYFRGIASKANELEKASAIHQFSEDFEFTISDEIEEYNRDYPMLKRLPFLGPMEQQKHSKKSKKIEFIQQVDDSEKIEVTEPEQKANEINQKIDESEVIPRPPPIQTMRKKEAASPRKKVNQLLDKISLSPSICYEIPMIAVESDGYQTVQPDKQITLASPQCDVDIPPTKSESSIPQITWKVGEKPQQKQAPAKPPPKKEVTSIVNHIKQLNSNATTKLSKLQCTKSSIVNAASEKPPERQCSPIWLADPNQQQKQPIVQLGHHEASACTTEPIRSKSPEEDIAPKSPTPRNSALDPLEDPFQGEQRKFMSAPLQKKVLRVRIGTPEPAESNQDPNQKKEPSPIFEPHVERQRNIFLDGSSTQI